MSHAAHPVTEPPRTTSPSREPDPIPRTAPPATAAAPVGRPKLRRRSNWRFVWTPLRWTGLGLAVLAPLTLLAAALIYLKLAYGAIPIRFMVEPIRTALLAQLDGIDVGIADAALHKAESGGLEVRLQDVSLATARGDAAVRAQEAIVGLDLGALRKGQVTADRIVLVGPRLVLSQDSMRLSGFASATGFGAAPKAVSRAPAGGNAAATSGGPAGTEPRFAIVRALAEAVAHLRRKGEAASRLRTFGVRDATLVIDDHGQRTVSHISELDIDVAHHKKSSLIAGKGRVAAGGVPFDISFSVDAPNRSEQLGLKAEIVGLSLPALARNVPHLGLLSALDAPVKARGQAELTADGKILSGRFDVDLGKGSILPDALGGLAIGIDGGRLAFHYDGAKQHLELAPSLVQLDGSWLKMKGLLTQVPIGNDALVGWQLDLNSIDGRIAEAPGRPATHIDQLDLRARLWPSSGASELLAFVFKAGGADIRAHGTITGGEKSTALLEGRIGPMDGDTIKTFWPASVSSELRTAVVKHLVKGRLKEGTFRITRGKDKGDTGLSMAIEAEDLAVLAVPGLPPVTVSKASLRRDGQRLEIDAPEAQLALSAGRRIAIADGKIVVTDLDKVRPEAEISGRGLTTLATLADVAGHDGIGLLKPGQVPAGADGKVEGQWRVTLPVFENVRLTDGNVDAKFRISDGRVPNVFGTHDITGASFTIGATERTVDVKGDLLIAGIGAKASGQWVLGEDSGRQSSFVVSTRLDGADRHRLGLTIEDLVQGEVPIEIQVQPGVGDNGKIVVNADLTAAELMIDGLSWSKPPGRAARLSFEVVRPRGAKTTELQAFRLSGENITINGSMTLGPDFHPVSYRFPGFSLNVVSNLEVEGARRADKVWEVKARARTLDGTAMMRSLYAVQSSRPQAEKLEPMDLDVRVDTVIGHNDTTVRQLKMQLKRRNEHMVGLDLKAVLDGGKPIEAQMQPGSKRVMRITTPDAGQALKTIGFYASMVGGKGDLVVNLDGQGGIERSGQIRISRFVILGDPVVSELVQGADETRPAIANRPRAARRVVREEIAFDSLRGSFSTGNQQVAIESLTAAGPLIGANVRGKMDFRTRSVSMGGTYVPLSGLNRVFAGIPIVGEILTGPRKDGMIGITFAVDGPMSKPNVIINPLSMVAPGLLREIFQMVPENPRVTPNSASSEFEDASEHSNSRKRRRRSGSSPQILDGWSSGTTTSGSQN